ncbi:MAG: MFS transporter [Halobacteriaceae archaeon]
MAGVLRRTPSFQQAIIGASAAGRFASSILMGTSLAVIVESQGGNAFAISMVLMVYFLGLMVFAPVWGAIADITGRRKFLLLLTGSLATLIILPLTIAASIWQLIGIRGLYAIFAAGFAPVMLTIVSERGGEHGRGYEIGLFNSARATGFASGQLSVGILLGYFVNDILYLFIAGISLFATVVIIFVDDPTETAPRVSKRAFLTEIRRRLFPAAGEREHLKSHGLQWLYIGLALRNMTVLGVMSLIPVYLTITLGLSTTLMGILLAINPVSQTVFMYFFGRIADNFGRKPLITLGMGGSAVFAIVTAGAVLPSSFALRALIAGIALLLIGASYSAMTTGAIAFIGDVAEENRESELMGLRSTAKGVGGVLGPPLVGTYATFTSFSQAFFVGSLLSLIAAILVFIFLTPTG